MLTFRYKKPISVLLAAILFTFWLPIQGQPQMGYAARIICVDSSAVGNNDGTSWLDAFTDLQSALLIAVDGDEIWVAAGTYVPGQNRAATFQLIKGVALYGGFPNGGGDWTSRDFDVNRTILSGDIGIPLDNRDNVYHVVTGSNTDNSAVLDGFVISNGNASSTTPNDIGGGIYSVYGGPLLNNLTISKNNAIRGGGIGAQFSNITITNTVFISNYVSIESGFAVGGGIYNYAGDLSLTSVQFIGNEANSVLARGGGIYHQGGNLSLYQTEFDQNVITSTAVANGGNGGGGIYVSSGNLMAVNVRFALNSAYIVGAYSDGGGGGIYIYDGNTQLANATFFGNHAEGPTTGYYGGRGGAIYNSGDSMLITNASFSKNSSDFYGNAIYGTGTVSNSIFWDNGTIGQPLYNMPENSVNYSIVQGGIQGTGNCDCNPEFMEEATGDLHLRYNSPAIDAGDNGAVFADIFDLDNDGNITEPLAKDLDYNDRFFDMPYQPNVGIGNFPLVDMGAYEVHNSAPTLDINSDLTFPTLLEDERDSMGIRTADLLIGGLNGDPITDPDGDAIEGIAIVNSDQNHGTWQFSIDDGVSWNNLGVVSFSSALVLGDDPWGRIRFIPDPNFNGAIDPGLTILAWDRTDGRVSGTTGVNIFAQGGATPFSMNSTNVGITILSVNDPPRMDAVTDQAILEDIGLQQMVITGISAGPSNEDQQITITVASSNELLIPKPVISYSSPNTLAYLTYTPTKDAYGPAVIKLTLKDDGGIDNSGTNTNVITFTVDVLSVNDPPSFQVGSDLVILEDSGEQHWPSWASEMKPGPENEKSQLLDFIIQTDQPALFSSSPSIDAITGDLSFTPAANAFGTATVEAILKDDGGVLHGGSDTFTDTFKITIEPVNDLPVVFVVTKTGVVNETIRFTQSDFTNRFTDPDGDLLTAVKIVSLPEHGSLFLNGSVVTIGQEISPDELDGLVFTPQEGWYGVASFSWNGKDGTAYAQNSSTVQLNISQVISKTYLPMVVDSVDEKDQQWINIVTEDFEGEFPAIWQLEDNYGSGEYLWGKRSCRPYSGNDGGWAVGGGVDGSRLDCSANYPYNADAWMIYGPFSLEDASSAELRFKLWLDSEKDYDEFCYMASQDNNNYGMICSSGSSGGWIERVLDLNNVPYLGSLIGKPQVWIGLYFYSDNMINSGQGAFVDDILLRKCVNPKGCSNVVSQDFTIQQAGSDENLSENTKMKYREISH